jgi:hypothetical protein
VRVKEWFAIAAASPMCRVLKVGGDPNYPEGMIADLSWDANGCCLFSQSIA